MSLHLIESPMSMQALHRWAGHRLHGRVDEDVALHHLLTETFGRDVIRTFRLMVAPRAQNATLYAYADRDADSLRAEAHATRTPGTADVLPLDSLRSLPRQADTWGTGQRLGFDLRCRPVVRLASAIPETDFAKGAELDAFLAETLRTDTARTREAVYTDWLAARLAPGAELDRDATWLAQFHRTRSQRKGRTVEGPDAVFHGTLTVTDPEAFATRLATGVGRHRAYGYGMLLLRPPQRRC